MFSVETFWISVLVVLFVGIESDYDGPSLNGDNNVTEEFTEQLLPYLEKQKKLHKKFAYQVSVYS